MRSNTGLGHRPNVPYAAVRSIPRRSLRAMSEPLHGRQWALLPDRLWADRRGRPHLPVSFPRCVAARARSERRRRTHGPHVHDLVVGPDAPSQSNSPTRLVSAVIGIAGEDGFAGHWHQTRSGTLAISPVIDRDWVRGAAAARSATWSACRPVGFPSGSPCVAPRRLRRRRHGCGARARLRRARPLAARQ